jgi:carbon-monoxide dehydrogenase large subunit
MLATIAARTLGVPASNVTVEHGDTAVVRTGAGTQLCRGAAVAAPAVLLAARRVREKAIAIAARRLDCAPERIDVADGVFRVHGRADVSVPFEQVARAAHTAEGLAPDMEPGLAATALFDPPGWSITTGAHVALVEVDAETGSVAVLRYIAADDIGRTLDATSAQGMIEGGIAHGIGQALFERVRHDENGQLLTASLMDYALPRADSLPNFETATVESEVESNASVATGAGTAGTGAAPASTGAGTAGAVAAPAAIANAVVDALAPFGITHIDLPLQPGRVWDAIRNSQPVDD